MSDGYINMSKLVYRSGKDSNVRDFVGLSHRLEMRVFNMNVGIDTLRDRNELSLVSLQSMEKDLPRVEYSEVFSHSDKKVPKMCGRLVSWRSCDDWERHDNVFVLSSYMRTIEQRIKNAVGPEARVYRTITPEILSLYI